MQTLKDKGKFPASLDDTGQSGVNETGTVQQSGTGLTQAGSCPVRQYALIGWDGSEICRNESAAALADLARKMWPDQEQDDTGSGLGWDIHQVGILTL